MKTLQRASWISALSVALVLGAAACSGGPADGHSGTGIVRQLDVAGRKITLDHEDIPGLMKAMTMTFDLSPDVRIAEIALGAKVDFRVREEQGVYTVTEIRRHGS